MTTVIVPGVKEQMLVDLAGKKFSWLTDGSALSPLTASQPLSELFQ